MLKPGVATCTDRHERQAPPAAVQTRIATLQNQYGPETAGRLAVRSIPIASVADEAAAVRRALTGGSHEIIDLVLVTDDTGHYRGVVEPRRILQAPGDKPITAMIRTDWPSVTPETDQEHAVEAAIKAGVAALPVVTCDGKPLGILSPRVLLDVLAREHREDIHRIVGILRERRALNTRWKTHRCIVRRVGCRGYWWGCS